MIALLAAAQTLLVVPFTVTGDSDAAWMGMAAAETILELAEKAPELNVLTVRQLNTVLKRRDLLFADVSSPEEARKVAVYLGATDVAVGTIEIRAGQVMGVASQVVQVAGGRASSKALANLVAKAALSIRPEEALRRTIACLEALLPQPLGPRARPVLAPEALARARGECEAALAADAGSTLARAGRALVLVNSGDAERGLFEARAAQRRGPVTLATLVEYYARMQLHDDARALAALAAAVKARPGFLHARGYIGEHHHAAKEHSRALEAFEAYLARCPGHPWVMAQIGQSLARLGKLDLSIAVTRRALALDPENAELAIELGSRLIDAGKLDDAVAALEPALGAEPRRPLAFLRLGYTRLLQGRLAEAVPPLQYAVTSAWHEDEFRTRGYAHFDLARVRARQGDVEEALRELADARAEGEPRKIPCAEPDLAPLAADARFKVFCR